MCLTLGNLSLSARALSEGGADGDFLDESFETFDLSVRALDTLGPMC